MSETTSDSISALTEEIAAFARERDWDQFHDPKNLVMLLTSELGELAGEFRWVSSADADAHAAGVARTRIEEEIADVAIGLLMLARRTQTDLAAAIRSKLKRNASLYPIELARGRAERPTTATDVNRELTLNDLTSPEAVRHA